MKNIFITLFFIVLSTSLMGQTRLVAHKSHSGSTAAFHHSLAKGNITGLGLGEPFKEWLVVDTVIYISDTVSVIKSTFHSTYDNIAKSQVDTINHDPVTSKDSIVKIIEHQPLSPFAITEYDSVTYVGFDQPKEKPVIKSRKKKHEILPIISVPDQPFNSSPWLWMGAIALVSILTGLLTWKAYQFKNLLNKLKPALHE